MRSKTGELARLDDTFLVFNGFPCINVAGLNRAPSENGRQRSMQEGECGPQTGLYYKEEEHPRTDPKVAGGGRGNRGGVCAARRGGDEGGGESDEDVREVSDTPFVGGASGEGGCSLAS